MLGWYVRGSNYFFFLILTSSTIDIKLEIYKNLENFELYFEIFVNFEFCFEFFVISSFLSMVDEVNIRVVCDV